MSASYDFSGSTALITGAAGDIGRAVARRLAGSGARIALTDLPMVSERLEATREECAAAGEERAIVAITADVTDQASVAACFAAATDRLGSPDLVFNNAGYQGAFAATPDYPTDDFSRVLAVNVQGVFNVLREGARRMRAEGSPGSIVNTASMAGVHGAPNMIAYSASKGAVISLTQSASKDLAPSGIRVNAISPAFIGPGAMWDRQVELQARAGSQYFSAEPAEVARQMIDQVPMRRYGTVDEVATTVLWLLSEDASYITGQNIAITGGI
ncbi:MAG: SDR family oxidoreductase [Acidobacteria bacterium]|nr:SDR family oxidoreductase [Acidobacteriota bacterium]